MIVVMKVGAGDQEIESVVNRIREIGLKESVIKGTELTVVAALGDDRRKDRTVFEGMAGVEKVVLILSPYKRASREFKKDRTIVKLSETCTIGGRTIPVIAGPCSVETEERIVTTAKMVKACGATALRGGAFKPRTNPYSFQGHGEEGLKMLAAARAETGLAIVTEVLAISDVDLVAKYADCLQIGTRNAQNFKLLEAVGRVGKPVLFKRGMSMTIDEFLQAAEYILDAGSQDVILCERGIRTFEDHSRNTLSLSAVVELHHRSHLPVAVDPSHGTGHRHLIPDMANASVACGADAIVLEVHHDPAKAYTDGAQSITPATLGEMMPVMKRVAQAIGRDM